MESQSSISTKEPSQQSQEIEEIEEIEEPKQKEAEEPKGLGDKRASNELESLFDQDIAPATTKKKLRKKRQKITQKTTVNSRGYMGILFALSPDS